jgi:fructokinase
MKTVAKKVYGGVETGGTKILCITGSGPNDIQTQEKFPTTTPEETIPRIIEYFKFQMAKEPLVAVGIASFGPLDLNPESAGFGSITKTPKPGWSGINLKNSLQDSLKIPVAVDTDVNAAALGEQLWGAARGLNTFIYLTIGTGIGGGGMINGQLMHGLTHPEMGHIRIPHDIKEDPFPGACPFHMDCWEGLAAGAAMAKRWGKNPEQIPGGHAAWKLETRYLALGVSNLIFALSPERIIIGGGIVKSPGLLAAVRKEVKGLLNNYIASEEIRENIDHYLVSPGLGDLSGVAGAMALAQQSRNPVFLPDKAN